MSFSFYKNASFLNAFWSVLEVVIFPLALLAATPLFITKLGVNQYGLWMLINSSLAFLDVLGFGVNETLIKYISAYRALHQTSEIKKLISTLFILLILAASVGISAGFLIAHLQPNLSWTSISTASQYQFYELLPVAFIGLILKMVEMFNLSVLKGYGRYDIASKFSLVSKLLIIASNVLLVISGFGLYEFFLGIIGTMALMCSLEFIYVSKHFYSTELNFSFNREVFKHVFDFARWNWIQVVFTTLSNQVDKMAVAFFVGLEELAYYSIGFLVFRQLYMVYQASISWLFPNISAQKEKNQGLFKLFQNTNSILYLGVIGSLLSFYFFSDIGLTLWLGPEKAQRSEFYILLFSALAGLTAFTYLPSVFFMGTGRAKTNTLLDMTNKTLNTLFALTGYALWGVMGLLYGLFFSQCVYLPLQRIVLFRSVIRIPVSDLTKSMLGTIGVILYLSLIVTDSNSWQWLGVMLIVANSYLILSQIHKNPFRAISLGLKAIESEVKQ